MKKDKNQKIKDTKTKAKAKANEIENKNLAKEEKIESIKESSKSENSKVEKAKKSNTSKVKKAKGYYSSRIALTATVIAIMIVLGLVAYVLNTIIKKHNYTTSNPVATIEVENFGTITVELYPEYAPNTVANFIALANNGFYNGLTFHRTIPDFMIQGGDPNGDGTGSAKKSDLGEESTDAYSIEGEFILNGFTKNTLKNTKGVLAMARSDYSSQGSATLTKKGYDSASCQFFITTVDNASLDGQYAAFGKVLEGMDIVEKIANVDVQTRENNTTDNTLTANKPVDPPVITKITVETNGVDYGKPTTITPFDYYSYMMQQYYGSSSSNN